MYVIALSEIGEVSRRLGIPPRRVLFSYGTRREPKCDLRLLDMIVVKDAEQGLSELIDPLGLGQVTSGCYISLSRFCEVVMAESGVAPEASHVAKVVRQHWSDMVKAYVQIQNELNTYDVRFEEAMDEFDRDLFLHGKPNDEAIGVLASSGWVRYWSIQYSGEDPEQWFEPPPGLMSAVEIFIRKDPLLGDGWQRLADLKKAIEDCQKRGLLDVPYLSPSGLPFYNREALTASLEERHRQRQAEAAEAKRIADEERERARVEHRRQVLIRREERKALTVQLREIKRKEMLAAKEASRMAHPAPSDLETQERQAIARMRARGMALAKIAKKLGRTPQEVRQQLDAR